jgi:hypothetical protein
MNDDERPTHVFLRAPGGRGARATSWVLKAAFAEMFPDVLDPAAVEAAYLAEQGRLAHRHVWCVMGERAGGPAWVTCRGCGLSVPGRDWRHHDAEAWMQYTDPTGLQRRFADACGLPIR